MNPFHTHSPQPQAVVRRSHFPNLLELASCFRSPPRPRAMSSPPGARPRASLDRREVRWSLTIEAYSAMNTPESWTSALPSVDDTDTDIPTRLESPPERHEQLPVAETPPRLPPDSTSRMRTTLTLPLRQTETVIPAEPRRLQLHPALAPATALTLDLSFPSDAFQANPLLTADLLLTPRLQPPAQLTDNPSFHTARRADGAFVSIGDVLSKIHRTIRAYDSGQVPASPTISTISCGSGSGSSARGSPSPSPTHPSAPYSPMQAAETLQRYLARRVATVNGFCPDRPLSVQRGNIEREGEGGARVVDRFVGHTLFAGLLPLQGATELHFQLVLAVPERYREAPPTPPSPRGADLM
ncbi:hypothetical protein MIND_00570900 [Mycena indigotica]|uniref:Uncharacterized protein n=1 Tax=Mycena indigotica TaxID=2126181 RepID=A0A8H6W6H5_9AGAR|nr:uncharacterized protein MIND_00570900 [Mycena indigotica]KAF7303423.1 hypothetical protein MIND_00570900 [Mycena indigotica]